MSNLRRKAAEQKEDNGVSECNCIIEIEYKVLTCLSLCPPLHQVFWRSSQWMWEWWPSGASAVTTTWQSTRRECYTERWVAASVLFHSYPLPFYARYLGLVHLESPLLFTRALLHPHDVLNSSDDVVNLRESKPCERDSFLQSFDSAAFLEGFLKQWTRLQDSIPEIGTAVSQCEPSSLLPTSPLHSIQKQETQSFSFSILLQSLWGEQPLFRLFSLSLPLPPFLHLILSLPFSPFFPSSFPYFERTQTFSVSLWSHTTDEMTHGRKRKKKRHSVAWPETEFPWRLLLSATQTTVARWWRTGVRLHLMGLYSDFFIQW